MGRVGHAAAIHPLADLPGGDAVAIEFHSSFWLLRQRKQAGIPGKKEAMEDNIVAAVHALEQRQGMLPFRQILRNGDKGPSFFRQDNFPLRTV